MKTININRQTFSINIDGEEVKLKRQEFLCLYFLAKGNGKIVSRDYLIENAWDDVFRTHRVVDVQICNIKRTFKNNNIDIVITSVPKEGYYIDIKKSADKFSITDNQTDKPKDKDTALEIGGVYKNKRNELATVLNFADYNDQKLVIHIINGIWNASKVSDFKLSFSIKI